ncbi:STAS domain-containing protein [Acanthopleuribacter pedis]|uniref:Anti-sigma factor antagonist n=1 Tax=Acanthopleuribacter pedis TaxID=442870 RepID=A0A8J7U2A8_9BACT|nr:STAS domain-containing protein [Acanthopleuribacter pedis]MBO1319098.1 STAS domain-containing protein [Acanthopleuribacter pedis]
MAELTIHAVEKESAKVLYPNGYINAHTVQDFEKSIQSILEEKAYKIVINCNELEYINSSGLGVLMGVVEEITENEGFLWLSNMNETVFNIFDTLGFTHLFNVYQTEEEALEAIK